MNGGPNSISSSGNDDAESVLIPLLC
jgi:hypothetical protein